VVSLALRRRLRRVMLSLFYKIDRIPSFDIRPARNALKLVRRKFKHLIHSSLITVYRHPMHGRRVFIIRLARNAFKQGSGKFK
jgi:hypothetical protein